MLILVMMGRWSDDSMLSCPRCPVVQCVRHCGDDVCCSVVFGTLAGVFVFSVMWSEMHVDICYLLSSVVISVRVPESGVCVYISGED